MKKINESRIEKLLNYIKTYQLGNGESPSYRTIMQDLKFSSLSMVERYVRILIDRGLINRDDRARISTPSFSQYGENLFAPIVGTVTCGAPILAEENIEGVVKLPKNIFGDGNTFILHAEGDSMKNKGISSGDLLVVKQTCTANNGDMVVALIDDSATVKTFYKKDDCIVLHPENEKYKDIIVKDVQILGVVAFCIHEF